MMTDTQAVLDAILDNVRDAIALADGDRQLLMVNKALETLLGIPAHELKNGTSPHGRQALDTLTAAFSKADAGLWQGRVQCGDGQERPFQLVTTAINSAAAYPDTFLGILRPTTLPAESESESENARFGHDELTGLPNRDIFMDRVDRSLVLANRGHGSVALLIMGLDRFTLVNDALGHGAGDRLLIEVARRLRQCIRETDTVVRLGGDKFALVMNIATMDDSVIVAEKVLSVVNEPFPMDGQDVVVTFSIGIAVYPQDASNGESLIKRAENALHYAKTSGRNQYQFFSKDMNTRARARLDLEARMRRALADNEFVVYYQPKVSADSNKVVGAEALIRWQDPERGMIPPSEFIPVAEETGLIEQVGAWVLEETCRQNKTWQDKKLNPVRISVNVSARQFRARSLTETVDRVLRETGLDARWLELEITESMLMNDVESAVSKMNALRDMGVGLSIDDFGTGYSSLSYLGRFPITTLKIDRAFISDVDTNPKTAEIARAIIGLSRGLNLDVVAEGCEVIEHVQFLRDHGCHTIQGFFYSRPVPADAFEQMLRDGIVVHKP